MDIRVLRYFLTVAREESFSRAAEALFISQPTLSRQIHDMEEELGARLFVRTKRSVRLTQEGMRLRRPAQEVRLNLAWKRYQILSPAAELFLERMREAFVSP